MFKLSKSMRALCATLAWACAGTAVTGQTYNQLGFTPHKSGEPYNTYKGLVMCGYQGWFGTPSDGSLIGQYERCYYHYQEHGTFKPGVLRNSIDFWPDMSEYTQTYTPGEGDATGKSGRFLLPNGQAAKVYSPYDESSVLLHFKWMQQYGIDGVFMQRFVGEIYNASHREHFDKVLASAFKGSDQYQRALSVMYDLSGVNDDGLAYLIQDAQNLMNTYQLQNRSVHPYYLYENGKPLLALWGVGFNDSSHPTAAKISSYIDQLKAQGWSIFLGYPTYWREGGGDVAAGGSQAHTDLLNLIDKIDAFFPWYVGRYDYNSFSQNYWQERIKADIQWCKSKGVTYALHVYPGGSDRNMHPNNGLDQDDPYNDGWRYGGKFYWNQLYNDIKNGAQCIYVGMFDEMDEGTAIFKQLNYKDAPSNVYDGADYWVTFKTNGSYEISDNQQSGGDVRWSRLASSLNMSKFKGIDDEHPTDFYLQLTGLAGKMLRGEADAPLSANFKYDAATQKVYLTDSAPVNEDDIPADGNPYTTLNVPGTVQAEDFNTGADKGYHFQQTNQATYTYRDDAAVSTSTSNGNTWIGFTRPGDWFKYTLNCTKAGKYTVTIYTGCGNTGGGAISYSMDGSADVSYTTPMGAWETFNTATVIENVNLTAGQHLMRLTVGADLNIDRVVFTLVEEAPQPVTSEDGTPYKTLSVPGTIEAEDFNADAEKGYYFKQDAKATTSYRSDVQVAIASRNGSTWIGDTQPGDWFKYTFNCAQAGTYTIKVYTGCGNDGGGAFSYSMDGSADVRYNTPAGAWETFTTVTTIENVSLTAGQHVLKLTVNADLNIDRVVFEQAGSSSADPGYPAGYPLTQTYERNPLLGNFPSYLFGSTTETGTMYTADPSARVWNINGKDVLYLYCSHDVEPALGCDRMDRYHVYSTEDMKTWTDYGEILNSADVNAQFGFTVDGFMWAPDCMYNPQDQLYYFFYPHPSGPEWNSSWKVLVAVSQWPDRGFQTKAVIEGLPSAIDPNIFLDDDGQPYLFLGGGSHLYGAKLNRNDWTQVDGEVSELTGMTDFHEGAWVFKHNGTYYLTYPDNHTPAKGGNRMRWATSSSPLGPWTPGGIYMYPHGEETAHGSVVNFKGQYYQFYHTGNLSGNGTLRSVCVDKLDILADGSLEVVRNWGDAKNNNLQNVSTTTTTRLEAENYNDGGSHYGFWKQRAGQMQTGNDGAATYISGMKEKEWTRYSVNVTQPGTYAVKTRMRKTSGQASYTVGIDGVWAKAGVQLTAAQGQWEEYKVDNIYIAEAGEHYIEWRGAGGQIDVDWLEIGGSSLDVPGTVEAEDFNRGGEGVGYHWQNQANATGGYGYREDAKFIDSFNDNGTTGYALGWTTGGDWADYTVNVTQNGLYKVTAYCSNGNALGQFKLLLDGQDITPVVDVTTTGGWGTYLPFATENVRMVNGSHTLRFLTYGGMNLDKLVFECTQAMENVSTGIAGPVEAAGRGTGVYLLDGQQVRQNVEKLDQLPSGIYIVNGKKVVRR